MAVQLPTAYTQVYGTQKRPLPTMELILMEDNSIKGMYLGDSADEPYEFTLLYENLSESQANEFTTAFNNSVANDPDVDTVDFDYDPEAASYNGYFVERPILVNIPGNLWSVTCRLWGIAS